MRKLGITIRDLAVHAGIALAALGVGLGTAVEPARAQSAPPIIRFFAAWADMRPEFSEPRLSLSVQVDDPDGQVPATIQSVIVTRPDGSTVDLTSTFRYPNLAFRGEYFLDAGQPVPGTYTLAVTDVQGSTATMTDNLAAVPPLAPPSITAPASEEIVNTPTPTATWAPVAGAGSTRVAIRNADGFSVFGDNLYTGPLLPGDATAFTVPPGVLTPGRRYVLEVQAHDTATGIPAANARSLTRRPFSVAGPNIGVTINQGAFTTGQTLRLGVSIRNDGDPLMVDAQVWAGGPGGAIVQLMEVADVEIPPTEPDASLVVNDLFNHTFDGLEPAGAYAVGIRLREKMTGAVIGQAIGSFTFAP